MERLNIADVIQSPLAVAAKDGQVLFERLRDLLQDEKSVELSFHALDLVTTAFLNSAIGQLYGEFPRDFIKEHLSVDASDSSHNLALVQRVTNRAREFYGELPEAPSP